MTHRDKAIRAIRAAKSESEVIDAVRDYVDTLDAQAAASLPPTLLVLTLTSAEEMIQSALHALHSTLDTSDAGQQSVLKDAAAVFSAAARRLANLS